MTVQTATEMWSRYGGDVTTKDGKTFNANIQRGFQVITDPGDLLEDVLFAPGLPRLGDLYPLSSQIRVKKKQPKQVSPVLWTVGVTY